MDNSEMLSSIVYEREVDQIIAKRGSKRYNGLYFRVKWKNDNENTWEPVCNFICLETEIINGKMLTIMQDYRDAVNIFPSLKRRCITCNRSVKDKNMFCWSAKCKKYGQLVRKATK